MKTIDFAYKTVNISRIGYLSIEIETGLHVGDRAVVMMVDGIELKERYKSGVEARKRYEQIQRKIGIIRC